MPPHFHVIVWIDHHQGKVFHFNTDEVDRTVVRPYDRTVHLHHKANTIGSGHVAADKEFLGRVTEAVAEAGTILIVEPAGDKTELANHLTAYAPDHSARVAGVEAVDHPGEGELLAKLRERLAKLAGSVAVIRVGAPAESEMKAKKEALDDAISATKAAVAEGIVPGGFCAAPKRWRARRRKRKATNEPAFRS